MTHTQRKETITIYPGSNFFLQQCPSSRKIESTSLVVATVFMALWPGFVVTFEKATVKNCLCLNMKPNNPNSKTSQSGNRYDKNMILFGNMWDMFRRFNLPLFIFVAFCGSNAPKLGSFGFEETCI